ncbi:hypothetical protein MRB53_020081 [Persea americana]|uniref:Uncharacterized protein n=1 Tax=Persea americana TaxID=3435 RepID=A0ACC2L156_PERAE|nr:hypothetical protein MRB53_020081 [Persea americana]
MDITAPLLVVGRGRPDPRGPKCCAARSRREREEAADDFAARLDVNVAGAKLVETNRGAVVGRKWEFNQFILYSPVRFDRCNVCDKLSFRNDFSRYGTRAKM